MGGKGSGRKPSPCGTPAKYQWHRKRKEDCSSCKEAHRQYYAARRNKGNKNTRIRKGRINRMLVRQFKFSAGSCMDCGLVVDERTIVCFDLDHRDPAEKRFTISYVMDNANPNDIRDELEKCDVVCRNCHALRTHAGQHHLNRHKECNSHLSLFD